MHVSPPLRKSYTYAQRLFGAPDDVFALLCPVRESEWIVGWNPRLVVTATGVAEAGCVFVTMDGQTASGALREATWVITDHEPRTRRLAMTKVSPDYLVTRIGISVVPAATPRECRADVRYEYTAIGPDGEAFVRMHTPEMWTDFMQRWERALNDFLQRSPEARGTTVSQKA